MTLAVRDWSNRPHTGDYAAEQMHELQHADYALLHLPPCSTARGIEFCEILKTYRTTVVPRVGLLHTFPADYYADTTWPWLKSEGKVLSGTELIVDGKPSVKWRQGDGIEVYNTDVTKVDPNEWARILVGHLRAFGFDHVFLDYLCTKPYDYDTGQSFDFPNGGNTAWQFWQRIAVNYIREWDINVCGNGRWALEEPEMLGMDMLYLEKLGTPWWPDPNEYFTNVRPASLEMRTFVDDTPVQMPVDELDSKSYVAGVCAAGAEYVETTTI